MAALSAKSRDNYVWFDLNKEVEGMGALMQVGAMYRP